jgi:hypothetical protein
LTDGGQNADSIATRISAFIDGANKSLDVAIYDLRLEDSPGATLLNSFQAAVKRGVGVRLMFNQDHGLAIPEPPPPEIDWQFVESPTSCTTSTRCATAPPS